MRREDTGAKITEVGEGTTVERKISSVNPISTELGPDEIALIEILKYRYEQFRDFFGRDPELDDPLFFDTNVGAPIPPDPDEARLQVIAAAVATQVDYRPVLRLMGLS
jgi:hypothetical protein